MDLQKTIWVIETSTEAILLLALITRGLASRYFAFTIYVTFDVMSGIGLMFFGDPAHSRPYQIAWMVTSTIGVILQVAVVLELFRRICDHYAGIGRFGKTLIVALVAAAALGCLVTFIVELQTVEWRHSFVQIVALTRRLTSTIFAFFLLSAAAFFSRFPTALRRNVIVHGRLLGLYFTLYACSYMTFVIKGVGSARTVGEVLFAALTLCFLAWTFLLRESGETVPELQRASDADFQRVERWNKQLLQAGRWLVS